MLIFRSKIICLSTYGVHHQALSMSPVKCLLSHSSCSSIQEKQVQIHNIYSSVLRRCLVLFWIHHLWSPLLDFNQIYMGSQVKNYLSNKKRIFQISPWIVMHEYTDNTGWLNISYFEGIWKIVVLEFTIKFTIKSYQKSSSTKKMFSYNQ